jgi:hypothetical protein
MKKVLLSAIILLASVSVFSLPANGEKEKGDKPATASATNKKPASLKQKGDKLVMCQVLEVTDSENRVSKMAVFVEVTIEGSVQSAGVRNSQLLKKEKNYLGRVFFEEVTIAEDMVEVEDVAEYMKVLKSRYDDIKLWGVLSADQIKR